MCVDRDISVINGCNPSPCGANSACREVNSQPVCSCLPNYIGSPPNCKPECIVNSECKSNRACVNQRCVNPCPRPCGQNTECKVIRHSPVCSCRPGFSGDPFTMCTLVLQTLPSLAAPTDPCMPSPCGLNAECRNINGLASCSCLPSYIGSPPFCKSECVVHSDCSSDRACVAEKCRNPCDGSCGLYASCFVNNHIPVCLCPDGFTGDPFRECIVKPFEDNPVISIDPCGSCGPNTVCNNGRCACAEGYHGDPNLGCRPECIYNSDCPIDKGCQQNKCVNPCIGTCGVNAVCVVTNHIPMCTCSKGMIGNAFIECRPFTVAVENPCNPSPCGPNSQCRQINGQAVCSCVPGYQGNPPTCRPECVVSLECSFKEACNNQKCVNPCIGACGSGAICDVINHNPICTCPPLMTGDPFVRCVVKERDTPTINPCDPSPCGTHSICKINGEGPLCACLPTYKGSPPNCRPECISNSECDYNLACLNNKCSDPCAGTCGSNAECKVVSHAPLCTCQLGYTGDPFSYCQPHVEQVEVLTPCSPSPCGSNAICKEKSGVGACQCLDGYLGNPYEGCRPECVVNSDCPLNKACSRMKCTDPCPGTCGQNALCHVNNHMPTCICQPGYTGNPFSYCTIVQEPLLEEKNPCNPSPCGANSQCKEINGQAVCSCLVNFTGAPPNCRPECVVSSECPSNLACINQKCENPCVGACGEHANCNVINHSPICVCKQGLTGNPFTRCYPLIMSQPQYKPPEDPCVPSPCGLYAECRNIRGVPSCSCLQNYVGNPPSCRPECTINSECPSNQACIDEHCSDPCLGACGFNARCTILNHIAQCACIEQYTGDPFQQCTPAPEQDEIYTELDPCNPSPCGANAVCNAGTCTCLPEYQGDPYFGCRPECLMSTDCPQNKACLRNKCVDPCVSTCGTLAVCNVYNHVPMCTCPTGFSGNAFLECRRITVIENLTPCSPSPCGSNSQCREVNGQAICTCLPDYKGAPPTCRPECVSSAECALNKACSNQRCVDPCRGNCGTRAICQVINHNPICSCPQGFTGDPFSRCILEDPQPIVYENPCIPSPCGSNSECKVINSSPSCACIPEFKGIPPNCRPECIANSECADNLACVNSKCKDPCAGSCGTGAECRVISHTPQCLCSPGYTGNAFIECRVMDVIIRPCSPSPCGPNAVCNELRGAGACVCLPDYIGNPYEGCRPECVVNSDCATNLACIQNKCQNPCNNICGSNAICNVINHAPKCDCLPGLIGNPYQSCNERVSDEPIIRRNPCAPSPCGPNSICKVTNDQAVCTCQPEFIGTPPDCRPECLVSSECNQQQACINKKCKNPCEGVCGQNTECKVINHSPICSCRPQYTGDPFSRCYPYQADAIVVQTDPCLPSPCGPFSQCRDVGGSPSCSCLPQYNGSPPNCRPECTINTDCPSANACINEKCVDPCPGLCGLNANCRVQNHISICTCIDGYTGDPFARCEFKPKIEAVAADPCHPNPCGSNAACNDGICTCLPDYNGDPYFGCRPECVISSECPMDKACVKNHCVNPCIQACGTNAICQVVNHMAVCTCPPKTTGNAFIECRKFDVVQGNPCQPSPCGSHSQCREYNKQAVCSCLAGYRGAPPACRPECVASSDCPLDKACSNQKCINPCKGACGVNALCQVIKHNPLCSCPSGMSGDPFTRCTYAMSDVPAPLNPCQPSPCGPNSICQLGSSETPSCQCMPDFMGSPPNCRPECISNSECSPLTACINKRCQDPCSQACGRSAECR